MNLIHPEEDLPELFLKSRGLLFVFADYHGFSAKEKLLLQKREIVEQELARKRIEHRYVVSVYQIYDRVNIVGSHWLNQIIDIAADR